MPGNNRTFCFLFLFLLLPVVAFSADLEQGRILYEKGAAIARSDPEQAEQFFQKSVQVFPSYEGYYALGKVQLKQEDFSHALDSFNKADSYGAETADRAIALAMSGQALAAMGRGREGLQVVEDAIALHPDAPDWMSKVLHAIEDDVADKVATADEITMTLDSSAGRGIAITPKIDLPVRFAYDSFQLEGQGEQQVKELAKALAKEKFSGTRFLIVGHTDLQGSEEYNQQLSRKRAEATVRALEQLQPKLRGYLRAVGRGMSEPRRREMTEQAHKINRRVEVRIDEH